MTAATPARKHHYFGTMEERFWPKVDKRGPDECWIWKSAKRPHDYGRIANEKGVGRTAHRAALEIFLGKEIPRGLVVMHRCDNPPCVNPAHLRVGTQRDNMLDRKIRGRYVGRRVYDRPTAC